MRRLFIVVLTGALGCHRVTTYQTPPITGLRFTASSAVAGGRADTVVVRVAARNTAREARSLEGGICDGSLWLRVYADTTPRRSRVPVWDSRRWERARNPQAVCLAVAVSQTVEPGLEHVVAQYAVAMRVILGDSLRAGRYRLTAQLTSTGGAAGELEAGTLALAVPPL